MQRLPPSSSAATLPSAFLSFLAHGAAVVAGLIMIPVDQPKTAVTEMRIIPVELVTVDEVTNLTAVSAPTAEKALAEATKEEESATVAGSPPPEEDTVSFEEPKPKPKDEPKKPEAKPSPSPAEDYNSVLDQILQSAKTAKPKTPSNTANTAPAASNEAPRIKAGDARRMTASITAIITSQLVSKGCWADHSDMADARRLRVTLRVWFGRNGKFSQPYQLISPSREPSGDPPMQAYLAHARRALDTCNNMGWQVPDDYFRLPQPQYIDIEFLPKIGASQ